MTFKIGDRVTPTEEFPSRTWRPGEIRTVTGFDKDGDPYMLEDGPFAATLGWGYADKLVLAGPEPSELDAIEREFTDLFARIRAVIDRMER